MIFNKLFTLIKVLLVNAFSVFIVIKLIGLLILFWMKADVIKFLIGVSIVLPISFYVLYRIIAVFVEIINNEIVVSKGTLTRNYIARFHRNLELYSTTNRKESLMHYGIVYGICGKQVAYGKYSKIVYSIRNIN